MSNTLALARRLLALGLSVFPIPRPQTGVPHGTPGDGKVAAMPWREYQMRLPADAELVRWFEGKPMNLAVVTGAVSGVVVVDADSPEALRWCTWRLPYTPWQTRTSRGFHLWYRWPGVRVPNQSRIETGDGGRLALDVRGDGGYVVAPGSLHASGFVYEWAGDWGAPRNQVPHFWPGWLAKVSRAVSAGRAIAPQGDAIWRARLYLEAIPRPEIGYGSDQATFYAACRLVRGFGLSAQDTEELLWEWAGNRPGWTREWVACKVKHAERYGTEPIGALR